MISSLVHSLTGLRFSIITVSFGKGKRPTRIPTICDIILFMKETQTPYFSMEQATKHAYDTMANHWTAERTPGFWSDEINRFHELLPIGSVVEIGSGGGRDAKELIAKGYDYVGTDISPSLLEIIQAELPAHKFYEQSVYDLSLPQHEPFDGFWACAVLLHIPRARIHEALGSIHRIVRHGAIGFISLKDGLGERLELTKTDDEQVQRLFSYWNGDEFVTTLVESGFRTVDYMYHPDEKANWHGFFVQAS